MSFVLPFCKTFLIYLTAFQLPSPGRLIFLHGLKLLQLSYVELFLSPPSHFAFLSLDLQALVFYTLSKSSRALVEIQELIFC